MPDMDVGRGRRRGALAVVVVAGGDFVAERPKAEEMDDTRVCDVDDTGEVVAESEARWRGGPISMVRAGLMVVGVGSLLVVLVGDVAAAAAVAFIRTLFPSVVMRVVVVEDTPSEALLAFGASLLSSERRDAGRDEWGGGGGENEVVDSRRIWPTLLGAGVGPVVVVVVTVPLTLIRRFN